MRGVSATSIPASGEGGGGSLIPTPEWLAPAGALVAATVTCVTSQPSLSRADLAAFAASHRADFERWIGQLVNIPSVSVDPARARDVRRCAEAAVGILESIGGGAELIETGGH